MTNDRAPVSAPTTGERQSIGDDPKFCELLKEYSDWGIAEDLSALIAHIDTWASRSAGDAVPAGFKLVPIEPTERMREAAASFGHPDAGYPYPNGYSKQRGEEAVESYRHMIGAAPAPGNTEKPKR